MPGKRNSKEAVQRVKGPAISGYFPHCCLDNETPIMLHCITYTAYLYNYERNMELNQLSLLTEYINILLQEVHKIRLH
jgi:hypothetical protein